MTAQHSAPPPPRPRHAAAVPVLFVLMPYVLMLDLAGPAEALRLASQLEERDAAGPPPRFALHYVSPAEHIPTSIDLPLAGLAPLPDTLPENAIVVIVGVTRRADPTARRELDNAANVTAAWLARVAAPRGHRVLCVCSGALIAARAGLLDGRQCTTHHALCDELRAIAPHAKVLDNRLYVTDGPISTSAGVTAGIDMALQLITEFAGPRAACAVARDMVVYMRRAGADPQLSPWVEGRNHLHPALHRVQDAVAADPSRDWSVERMARIACASPRHLARLFHEYAGTNPVDYVHRLRIAMARELIAHSSLDMETVAERAGFGSARHMRRIWQKYDAAPPSSSRRTRAVTG